MSSKHPIFVTLALLLLGAARSPLDTIARDYVQLSLEAGEREPEYVDAYYGPPAWAAAAKANPRTVDALRSAAAKLTAQAKAVAPATLSPLERRRRAFLIGQLTAAETRLAMHAGKRFTFEDEAEGLFGVRPALKPLASYDATLAAVDRLLPGPGDLWQRVDTYRNRFVIPAGRLNDVMHAAIAECRRRTVAHIPLPADEKFKLELVTGKPWSGYNYYKGNNTSLIQVNTDLPVLIDRAVDLGCHEGYPGHHVYNMLLEQRLARARGWIEFMVYPLYGPQSLIAEGSANYGIELAFPGAERATFEAKTLYPLAGLDPAEAPRYAALLKAMQRLSGARFTIAQEYLDGRLTRSAAVEAEQKYELLSLARAEKAIGFTDHYRSYVINYGLGKDMVKARVEAAGQSQKARWQQMASILSQPTIPADLATAR
ncbi:hypothetical protein [Glacieibacterium sp.]|uniref:hypothetical protein n=1 Tax=Glacieibacterium sp. TaxID=2860237 RepID=UPI003AFFAA9C